ncbi:MAG TPA: hypothetical protein VGJ47_01760 [Gemmatimonadaceae bacterium]
MTRTVLGGMALVVLPPTSGNAITAIPTSLDRGQLTAPTSPASSPGCLLVFFLGESRAACAS